jgi:hypothetical protein
MATKTKQKPVAKSKKAKAVQTAAKKTNGKLV